MSQGSFNQKIRFLDQKVCPVARPQTDRHTRKWLLRAPFQGFRIFSFKLSSRIGPIKLFILYIWLYVYFRPPAPPPKPKKRRIGHTHTRVGQPKLFSGSLEEYIEATSQEIPLIIKSCIRVINLYGESVIAWLVTCLLACLLLWQHGSLSAYLPVFVPAFVPVCLLICLPAWLLCLST